MIYEKQEWEQACPHHSLPIKMEFGGSFYDLTLKQLGAMSLTLK